MSLVGGNHCQYLRGDPYVKSREALLCPHAAAQQEDAHVNASPAWLGRLDP